MIANVNEQLWIDFGLDTAVFLDTIAYWIKTNASNKQPRNFREGRYWTYNTLDALHTMFPGWSRDTIRGIIRKCVKNGLLIVGNFNKQKYDRTCWYTLTDTGLEYYSALWLIVKQKADNPGGDSCGDFATPSGESPTPIPTLLSTSSNNTITTNSESDDSSNISTLDDKSDYFDNHEEGNSDGYQCTDCAALITKSDYHNNRAKNKSLLAENAQPTAKNTTLSRKVKSEKGRAIRLLWEMIAVYREVFPNNPQPHPRVISTSLQKTLQTLIKRWHELDPDGKEFDIPAFTRYMNALKSLAPKFSLGEYETQSGNKKKNNLETFSRWNTLVKFLENQYS